MYAHHCLREAQPWRELAINTPLSQASSLLQCHGYDMQSQPVSHLWDFLKAASIIEQEVCWCTFLSAVPALDRWRWDQNSKAIVYTARPAWGTRIFLKTRQKNKTVAAHVAVSRTDFLRLVAFRKEKGYFRKEKGLLSPPGRAIILTQVHFSEPCRPLPPSSAEAL